ncbi:DNA-binding protein, partial [Synechococcus sp. R3-13]
LAQMKDQHNLAKAAKVLYEAELGFMGRPGRSFFEAPFRAQEYLSRLQAEMAFANINSGSVSDLQNQAQELLSNVNTDPGSYTFADYSLSKAALYSARAALHLLAAERLGGMTTLTRR